MASAYGETPLGLSSVIVNVASVLTRKASLRAPGYQRPFTWEEREVRELLQDLWRAFKRGATFYFIGQIVLVRNSQGQFEIADGQQRLATMTMIIAYVRDRLPNRAKHYQGLIMEGDRVRLVLRKADAGFYLGMVQEPNRMTELRELPIHGVESRDLLALAARTIHAELREVEDRELDAFMSYVLRCCTLNVVDAAERGCAQTVFNALNRRGSPLSEADIIKSDLIESAGMSEREADDTALKWEETEVSLPREDFAKLLSMMPFLLTGEKLVAPGDLVSFRDAVDSAGGVHRFVHQTLPRYARALRDIFHGTVNLGAASTDVNRRLKLMKQIDKWDWAPPALAFIAEHSDEPERAQRFFQALDRFSFACEFAVVPSGLRDGRYSRAVRFVGDDSKLHGKGGALELTDKERLHLIARLNESTRNHSMRRLLLLRIEAAMPNGSLLSLSDVATVEHVLPKKGGKYWDERFFDKRQRDEAAHMLGNCVLLTHKQNETAGNRPYSEKREVFFNTPGATVHAVTEDIRGISDWTFQAIEERGERLVRILCADWAVGVGED